MTAVNPDQPDFNSSSQALRSGPFSEWVRFSTSGSLLSCTEWLLAKWEEMGALESGKRPEDFFVLSSSDRDSLHEAWTEAMAGRSSSLKLRLLGRDRSESLCYVIPEFAGDATIASVMVGVAPSAREGGNLSEKDRLLAEAIRSTSSPMAIVDESGSLMWANEAFGRLIGRAIDELAGSPLLSLFHSSALDSDRQRLERLFAKQQPFCEEAPLYREGGYDHRVRMSAAPIESPAGGKPCFAVECRLVEANENDLQASLGKLANARLLVRERIGFDEEVEATFDALREELEMARGESEAKSEFLANISHEIRTPMNAVIGFCDLLQNTRLDQEQSECVEAIYHSGQLLIQLIGQVLDYSRIDSGHLELVDEELDLEQTLMEAQAILCTRARAKNLAFTSDFKGLLREPVIGDSTRIKQIVVNLLGNAFKFTRSGHIELSARTFHGRRDGDVCLRVRVEDSGIGVDPSRLATLFDPFAQADSRIARDFGGSGLGLAICKRLCLAMGGDIWVESTSKAGTVFCFEIQLPLAMTNNNTTSAQTHRGKVTKELERHAQANPAANAKASTSKLRVLVVDDNPNNLLITSKLSEHLGYEVETVRSGVEAIEKLQGSDFEIVLMDVRMAPINGMETTERIRNGLAGEGATGVYIIALTAHALQGDRERCMASGMNDYLAKPLTLEKLQESLDRARDSISLD